MSNTNAIQKVDVVIHAHLPEIQVINSTKRNKEHEVTKNKIEKTSVR